MCVTGDLDLVWSLDLIEKICFELNQWNQALRGDQGVEEWDFFDGWSDDSLGRQKWLVIKRPTSSQ